METRSCCHAVAATALSVDMLTSTVYAAAVAIAGLYLVVQQILTRRRTNVHLLPTPPGDESTWLFGHELKVWEDDESEAHTRWTESVGQVYRVKSAFRQDDMVSPPLSPSLCSLYLQLIQLYVVDHAAAHHIFTNVDTYVKPPYFRNHIGNMLGRGLIWAEHGEHRMQRRLTSPAFSTESILGMEDFVTDACEKVRYLVISELGYGG